MSAITLARRLEKLEAVAPRPPSPLDGMTSDELSVLLLEEYSGILATPEGPTELVAQARNEMARLVGEITDTVNFASGRWALPPGFNNYQEHIASMKAYWERTQTTRGEYVPSLNYAIETDGFAVPGRGEPAAPDLMARRTKLWQHPIVKQIVKDARTAEISDTLFHECGAFKSGNLGKPSSDCSSACARQCLNSRRGGFQSNEQCSGDLMTPILEFLRSSTVAARAVGAKGRRPVSRNGDSGPAL